MLSQLNNLISFTIILAIACQLNYGVSCAQYSDARWPPTSARPSERSENRNTSRWLRVVYEGEDSGNLQQNDQPIASSSSSVPNLDQCCACDEAKYELVFEGLWSRYTHPDEFPENYWLAHFSDIIGASHSNEFRMWSKDSFASEGVKELAETGSTKRLESELKQVSSKTRTIIKARELRYPTLNSKTSAVFRTDRQHHLVSILSKLGPSPDWMVGVSGLELCQLDCTWASQRIVNLYIWDAGTDSGTTFTAPDSPSRPQEHIHPFKRASEPPPNGANSRNGQQPSGMQTQPFQSDYLADSKFRRLDRRLSGETVEQSSGDELFPNDSSASSPYTYPASQTQPVSTFPGDHSKPYARLTITRQRIYEKTCNGGETVQSARSQSALSAQSTQYQAASQSAPPAGGGQENTWIEPPAAGKQSYSDCRFTDWSDWSSCSSTCGKGIRTRTRTFVDEQAHLAGCLQSDLIEREVCLSECIKNSTCVTRDWSDWSKCSVNCGQGFRRRTRSPIGTMKKACELVDFVETEPCMGSRTSNCSAEESACELSEWSQWSECSVACGKGTRIRTRQHTRKENFQNCTAKLIQKQPCTGRIESCRTATSHKDAGSVCKKASLTGPCRAAIIRWYYNELKGQCAQFIYGGCSGNSNNFQSFQDCQRTCSIPLKHINSSQN